MNYKPSLAIQILVSAVFIILLGIPIFLDLQSKPLERKTQNREAMTTSIDLFGFYLEDVGEAVNVDFVHKPPRLDARLDHILPQIASVGASVSVCDFNKDGWNDFYLTTSRTGESNALYQNMQDGTFEDVASEKGLGNVNGKNTGVSMGSIWADIDNSGSIHSLRHPVCRYRD